MSLESLVEDNDVVDTSDVDEVLTSPTEGELDIGEVEEIAQAGDDAIDTANDLSKTADIVERSDELTQPAMEMLGKILEMASARTGFKSKSVSMESTQVQTKQMALESIGEHVEKIILAVVAFIRKAWLKVKEFFAQFFDRVKKVKKMAQALEAKAKTLKDNAIAEKDF